MASLWIRSGYDMKVEMSAKTYQVGAHFKALIKATLVAPLKSFARFFRTSSSPAGLCGTWKGCNIVSWACNSFTQNGTHTSNVAILWHLNAVSLTHVVMIEGAKVRISLVSM